MNDFPVRNEAAQFAMSVFYEDFNDIDVYIEDTGNGYEKIFAVILQRLLGDALSVTKIFALGGRERVIESAKLPNGTGRRSVFIVDGDLYLLCGEFKPLPPNVFSLNRYCIENFLVDEEALIDIMDDEDPMRRHGELKECLDFEGWRLRSSHLFQRLFVIYAVAHVLGSGEPTVSRKMNELLKNEMGEMEAGKVDAIILLIRSNLNARYSEERVDAEIVKIEKALTSNECFVLKYVSAKNYTLPMLFLRMRSVARLSANNLTLKMKLAKRCNLIALDDIKAEIFKIAK